MGPGGVKGGEHTRWPEPVSAAERARLRAGHDPSWWGEFAGETVWEVWYRTSTGHTRHWETYRREALATAEAEKIGAWFPWVEIRRTER